mmetsp:Transcript_12415/g.37267  ORF Transcript_12415/g.37267 Transcript_12415/m.37267 type:complete len:88 (+) Transcript_12415:1390-1653(+)
MQFSLRSDVMVSLFTRDFYSIFFVFTSVYLYYSLSIFMTLFLSSWISLTLLSLNPACSATSIQIENVEKYNTKRTERVDSPQFESSM